MRYDPAHTAILFFSRSASAESAAKPFDKKNNKKAEQLAHYFIQHSLRTARKTKLPLITCFSQQQRGDHFGERLANAIESVWDQGFQHVIVMGNDCLSLTPAHILNSARSLHKNPLVMSPAQDGGVNLIGLDRSHYDRQTFTTLAWESDQLQQSWNAYAKNLQSQILWLDTLRDIDHVADLYSFLKQRASLFLRKQIQHILHQPKRLVSAYPPTFSFAEQQYFSRFRGPPC